MSYLWGDLLHYACNCVYVEGGSALEIADIHLEQKTRKKKCWLKVVETEASEPLGLGKASFCRTIGGPFFDIKLTSFLLLLLSLFPVMKWPFSFWLLSPTFCSSSFNDYCEEGGKKEQAGF